MAGSEALIVVEGDPLQVVVGIALGVFPGDVFIFLMHLYLSQAASTPRMSRTSIRSSPSPSAIETC